VPTFIRFLPEAPEPHNVGRKTVTAVRDRIRRHRLNRRPLNWELVNVTTPFRVSKVTV
jgi:hypothetical protein